MTTQTTTDTRTPGEAPRGVGRRTFVAGSGAAVLGGLLGGAAPVRKARAATGRPESSVPKNVILMVSDGMSLGTMTLADLYAQSVRGEGSYWRRMLNDPRVSRGLMSTMSADSLVTDSAAAGSAWAIGKKVNNRSINTLPDGGTPMPLGLRVSEAGRSVGLVTTTRITHATPAVFAATVPKRNMEREIAEQLAVGPVDVLLGGGAEYFEESAMTALAESGAEVVGTAAALTSASRRGDPSKRLVGLFADSHMSYEIDRSTSEPSLDAMTRVALDRLAANPKGFFLMVEGGRVDHAAHANDAASLVTDQLAFDRALASAASWADRREDTLVIATTDHANANPGLTLYGGHGKAGLVSLQRASHSFEWIFSRMGRERDRDARLARMPELVADATGVSLNEDEVGILIRAARGEAMDPFGAADSSTGVLGSVLANHNAVGWVSVNHTSDDVLVSAIGPGADRIPGVIDNTELGLLLADLLGLS